MTLSGSGRSSATEREGRGGQRRNAPLIFAALILPLGPSCGDPKQQSVPPRPDREDSPSSVELVDTAFVLGDSPIPDSVEPPGPGRIVVEAGRSVLIADGRDETSLLLSLTDEAGEPVPDGAAIPLGADLGRVELQGEVRDGQVEALFGAGTWPGTATLSAEGWTLEGDTTLLLESGLPRSVQLHLHGSLSEGAGTMRGSIATAELESIDVLWWTDHDFQYYPNHFLDLTGYDFESGGLLSTVAGWPSTSTRELGWVELQNSLPTSSSEVSADAAQSGAYGWHLEGVGADPAALQELSYTLSVEPRLNFKPLLSQVDFGFSYRPVVDDAGAELFITVPLSARDAGDDTLPESYRAVHFYRSATDYSSLDDTSNLYIRLGGLAGEWSSYSVDLSDLVERAFPLVGVDQHAEFLIVSIRAGEGATASFDLDDFQWSQALVGEDLREEQRDFLADQPTEVVQLVGAEITLLEEGHFNAFGDTVPFIPYEESDEIDADAAVGLVHEAGGIVSFNHMFGVSGELKEEALRALEVDEAITTLAANGMWGCDLFEVGYRQRGGELADFLTVWDALSAADLFVTGEGASDAHDDTDWSVMRNRFVTWVPVGEPSEAELLWNLRRGIVWFGDPLAFEGGHIDIHFTAPDLRATMGQVVVGAEGPVRLSFTADNFRLGQVLRLVADGVELGSWPVEADGAFAVETTIDVLGGRAARWELLSSAEVGLLFTNPIYFVDSDPGTIPEERLPRP